MKNNKALILVVDDDSMIRESLQEILSDSGKYEVVMAEDGLQALQQLKRHESWGGLAKNKIDCIFLDIKMPNMDGLTFLKTWRKAESVFDQIPIILLTAYENDEIWEKATVSEDGLVSAYLKKPVKEELALDLLEKILVHYETEILRDMTREKGKEKLGQPIDYEPIVEKRNKKALILIVDDDPMVIESLSEIIGDDTYVETYSEKLSYGGTSRGSRYAKKYELLTANSGAQALEIMTSKQRWGGFSKHPIDCIILDIKMPDMDGLQFLQKWRETERFETIPVILLSAYEDEEKWAKATDVSKGLVAKYLKKPVGETEILESLNRILFEGAAENMADETRESGYDRRNELKKSLDNGEN